MFIFSTEQFRSMLDNSSTDTAVSFSHWGMFDLSGVVELDDKGNVTAAGQL